MWRDRYGTGLKRMPGRLASVPVLAAFPAAKSSPFAPTTWRTASTAPGIAASTCGLSSVPYSPNATPSTPTKCRVAGSRAGARRCARFHQLSDADGVRGRGASAVAFDGTAVEGDAGPGRASRAHGVHQHHAFGPRDDIQQIETQLGRKLDAHVRGQGQRHQDASDANADTVVPNQLVAKAENARTHGFSVEAVYQAAHGHALPRLRRVLRGAPFTLKRM